jgi:hypothetical protein
MVLGLTHHETAPKRFLAAGFPSHTAKLEREAIENFGKNRNAVVTYRHWRNEELTPTVDFRFDFEGAFNEAAAHAANIHFNLDGFNLRQGWRLGQNADPYLCEPDKHSERVRQQAAPETTTRGSASPSAWTKPRRGGIK